MTTPEKFDAVTRRSQGGMSFLSDVALFCIDEVHILADERGPALEAVVSRLKLLSRLPSLAGTPLSRLRFVAVRGSAMEHRVRAPVACSYSRAIHSSVRR